MADRARRASLALAAAATATLLLACVGGDDSGLVSLDGGEVDESTLPVTVPYREVVGAIIIDVVVGDGDEAIPMILDTGAPMIVSETIAAIYADDTAGTIEGTTVDGQTVLSDVVRLPAISIGGAEFSAVDALVRGFEPGDPFTCLSEAGFVGANLMQHAVWQIDPSTSTLTIAATTEGLDHLDDAIRLEFSRAGESSPSPLIELSMGEDALPTLIDTGSDGWFVTTPSDLETFGVGLPDEAPTVSALARSAAGPLEVQARWVVTDLLLADGVQALPIASIEALPPGWADAGTDFLSRFVLTIDWTEDLLYLDPIASLVPSTPPSAGLAWDEGYVVGSLVEGLPANAGLILGAEVTAIDGTDVSAASFDDFCAFLRDTPSTYEMTVAGEVLTTVEVAPVEGFFGSSAGARQQQE